MNETRMCQRCGAERPLSDFYDVKGTGTKYPACSQCHRTSKRNPRINRHVSRVSDALSDVVNECRVSYQAGIEPFSDEKHVYFIQDDPRFQLLEEVAGLLKLVGLPGLLPKPLERMVAGHPH